MSYFTLRKGPVYTCISELIRKWRQLRCQQTMLVYWKKRLSNRNSFTKRDESEIINRHLAKSDATTNTDIDYLAKSYTTTHTHTHIDFDQDRDLGHDLDPDFDLDTKFDLDP